MESVLTISPLTALASSTAKSDLPTPVVPTTARTEGLGEGEARDMRRTKGPFRPRRDKEEGDKSKREKGLLRESQSMDQEASRKGERREV